MIEVKGMDFLKAIMLCLLSMSLFLAPLGSAYAASELVIEDVDYDDPFSPGDAAQIHIDLENTDSDLDIEDLSIEVWLEDDSGDTVADVDYDLAFLPQDSERTVSVVLQIPDDAFEDIYVFKVYAEGKLEGRGDVEAVYQNTFDIEQEEHALTINSINIASSNIIAGNYLDLTVSISNTGLNHEQSTKVEVSIPELGLKKTITLLDTLQEGEEYDALIRLLVPDNAQSGIYTLAVKAYSDEAYTSYDQIIVISGVPSNEPTVSGGQAVPKGGHFMVAVRNNANIVKSYTLTLSGIETWAAESKIVPQVVTLAPGESTYVSIYVTPEAGSEGVKTFDVLIKDGAQTIGSTAITADVSASGDPFLNQLLVVCVIVFALLIGATYYNNNKKPARGRKKSSGLYY